MAETVTPSLVRQFAVMKPTEFGPTIEPKWKVADALVKQVRSAVEKEHLTPLDGARVISSSGHALRLRRVHPARDLPRDAALSTVTALAGRTCAR